MPPLSSTIHLCSPISTSSTVADRTYILYYITGNPGLIEYYRTFLTHLYGLLTSKHFSSSPSLEFQVFGRSLYGFEVDGSSSLNNGVNKPAYSLEEQIIESERCLVELVESTRANGAKDVRVILMGHSVGSYILLETIRRIRAKGDVKIAGGVCLFPTVTDIAKSKSGRIASPLLAFPQAPLLISYLAKIITFFLPISALSFLIQTFMRFPPDAAHVTASFVKSSHGIHQGLHMAHDEMQTITADKWDADIWGAAELSGHGKRPVLRFLFAKEDHWVANETRDELIRLRSNLTGDEAWKPKMEVDEEHEWPHAFCIKHSVPVAQRVIGYIEDIIGGDFEM